jgi:hypothetical protein
VGSTDREGGTPISSGTGKTAFIALKNLQNPRICHVPI